MRSLRQLWGVFFILQATILLCVGGSGVDDETYFAAVVEYHPNKADLANIELRLTEYVAFIERAAQSSVDIIVFPESTLTDRRTQSQLVPEPDQRIVPCGNATYAGTAVERISCAARTNSIYVVINLTMRRPCDQLVTGKPCGGNVWNLFNTNVVFDRLGTVISIYRKVNLFGEIGIDTTAVPDVITFATDFGVEFGHFICFDLMFDVPANEMVRKGVQNFVFPTMWFAEIPFLSGVQAQQGWSYAFNVNLLAAGANDATVGSTGSGIYAGRSGPLQTLMHDAPDSQLLISEIRKQPGTGTPAPANTRHSESFVNLRVKRDKTPYTFRPFIVGGQNRGSLSVNGHTCNWDYAMQAAASIEGQSHYTYYLAMYDGSKSYDGFAEGALRLCSLVACTDPVNTTTCGLLFPSSTVVQQRYTFSRLSLGGTFYSTKTLGNLTMPTTLTTSMLPLNVEDFRYVESIDDQLTNVTMTLTKQSHLLTFGVYSIDFSGASSLQVTGALLGICALFAACLN